MGLRRKYLDFIERYTFPDMYMCELGNQLMRNEKKFRTGKEYFQNKGIIHTSIDINGKDGALPIDLTVPILDSDLLYAFDIVTNSGTSEHVKDQYWCFWNIHNLCKTDGLMLHLVPGQNYWKKHGFYTYEFKFFEELSNHNEYELLETDKSLGSVHKGKERKNCLRFVAMKKSKDISFMNEKEFYKMRGLYNE